MDDFSPSDLKTILHSKRANMYYLEHCRVMQKDGRVLYLTEAEKNNLYFNIPIANTTVILLGTGTSITQAAVRMLAQAGVLIGFSGGGGTPLYMGNEIEWLTPQSEYRPTEYLQGWLSFWFDDEQRLRAAKVLQQARIDYLCKVWGRDRDLIMAGFDAAKSDINDALDACDAQIAVAAKTSFLLATEAKLTKQLYKIAAGKTRRGALVFDVADLVKDAIVLPWSFICAKENATEQEFRQQCLQAFADHKALDFMFDQIKALALNAREEESA